MSINQSRYVNIVSGVGGGNVIPVRALITRIFTTNTLIPPGTQIEFTSAAAVGYYFGFSSAEYLRASFYFAWVSKGISQAQKISFARWVNTAVGSMIFGNPGTYAIGTFNAITNGDFTLNMGGFSFHLTAINLSAAGSLAAVAAALQTAIRAQTGGGAAWTGATVTFDAVRGCFDLVSGATGADVISITPGVTTDLLAPLGWTTGAILTNGSAIETLTTVLTNSASTSNNFGSFTFIGGSAFTTAQHLEVAQWNATMNNFFQYLCAVTVANAATISAALIQLPGVAMTLNGPAGEYHELMPGMILAATDYTKRNTAQNYMFQQFPLTPTVTSDANANLYDGLLVNYYGVTQSAGQLVAFYQRGKLTGGATAPTDQNTYANEQWLKAAAGAALLTLLLSLARVSANLQGITQINAVLQTVINQALTNGSISVGKTLNITQQLYITNATGNPQAWQQVQTIGYWVGVTMQKYTAPDNSQEYEAVYTLIYSKDDDVRMVQGTDVLI